MPNAMPEGRDVSATVTGDAHDVRGRLAATPDAGNGAGGAEHVDTVVVGAGQAGLAVGHHLAKRGLPFVILEGNERVGESWRRRWDSLRLFTPARYDGLAGMPFPASRHSFPTKDAMADYLEAYAQRFELPVRTGVKVDRLSRNGAGFVVASGEKRFIADNVVVAMATYQRRRVPTFAAELDPAILQIHSSEYKNPSQLRGGAVLVVGAGNSGGEIALDVAADRRTWLSGRDTGHVPFRIDTFRARLLIPIVLRFVFHRVLTTRTAIGRKKRASVSAHGMPLVRTKPKDLAAAGVERVGRTVGVRDGRPLLEDGRVLDVANVIWCTGYEADFSWIDLPVFGETEPLANRGIVEGEPGLYFVGLFFLYAASSTMVHGVDRDAQHIVKAIASRS